MGWIRSVAASAVVGLLLLSGASSAWGAIEGRNGWIAFDSNRGSSRDIYLVKANGSGERRLAASDPSAVDARPAWAPWYVHVEGVGDLGTGTLEVSGGGFSRLNPTGGVTVGGVNAAYTVDTSQTPNVLTVTVPDGVTPDSGCVTVPTGIDGIVARFGWQGLPPTSFPEWPTCQAQPLAFQSNRTGDFDIWVTDMSKEAGAGNPVDVTPFHGSHETAPAWSVESADAGSPVGSTVAELQPLLAFESDRRGNRDIFVLDPSLERGPTNPAQVTSDPADDANPDWSPNGKYIVFESDRDGQKDIWTVRVRDDNGEIRPELEPTKITYDQPPSFEPAWYFFPEGAPIPEEGPITDPNAVVPQSSIVYSGEETGAGCELNLVRYSALAGAGPPANPSALQPWTLPQDQTKDDAPVFSPDGQTVLFHSAQSRNDNIYGLQQEESQAGTPRTDTLLPLTADRGTDRHPAQQAFWYSANLHFNGAWGRARPRKKKRRPHVAQAASAPAAEGCSQAPTGQIDVRPRRPRVGQTVTFDARGSRDADGPVIGYEWDLDGNGKFEESGSVVHRAYRTRGTRIVTLRVVDEDGGSERTRREVPVGTKGKHSNCTKLGTKRRDVIRGTRRRDVICGLGGNDTIYGEGAADTLRGDAGNDRVLGGPGRDALRGGPGNDRLRGGPGPDALHGDAGRDRLYGEGGGDRLTGGSSRDRLVGGGGRDRFYARDANRDIIVPGPGRDWARLDRPLDHMSG